MGRRAIVLLVALILAGLAAWAVWNFMQNVRGEAEAGQEQVTVFRAGPEGIPEGTEGSILVSDFDNGGTLIEEGTDEVEDTPADAIQSGSRAARDPQWQSVGRADLLTWDPHPQPMGRVDRRRATAVGVRSPRATRPSPSPPVTSPA